LGSSFREGLPLQRAEHVGHAAWGLSHTTTLITHAHTHTHTHTKSHDTKWRRFVK
jgi:hypothetical protein